jgi:5-methyltetrahydrofolate--homocysteine methyltransferase
MNKNDLDNLLRSRPILLDGGYGFRFAEKGMPDNACPEDWALKHPEILKEIYREYIEAGSDIIYTFTLGANESKLSDYGLKQKAFELNYGPARLAKEAAEGRVLIAGDIGPTGAGIKPLGSLNFEEAVDIYKRQVNALLEGGVDLFVIETMIDIQEARAAALAIKETCDLPFIASVTFEKNGRTVGGTSPEAAMIIMQSLGASAVGTNCGAGPDSLLEIVKKMKQVAKMPVIAKPNGGIPRSVNGKTRYDTDPESFVKGFKPLLDAGASVVGGCCGTDGKFIRGLKGLLKDASFEKPAFHGGCLASGTDAFIFDGNDTGLIIGERINPTGKKKLQEELASGRFDLLMELARIQENAGAQVLDVNVAVPGCNEADIMTKAVEKLSWDIKVPLCLDSADPKVFEKALRIYPGRALVNSVSLDGEKTDAVLSVVKKYGSMTILLPLSGARLPKSIEEKHENIRKLVKRAKEYGLSEEDFMADALTMSVASVPKAALDVLDTVSYCKEKGWFSISGLSNISFGMPERKTINATMMAMAIQRGLNFAISDPTCDRTMNAVYAAKLLTNKDPNGAEYIKNVRKINDDNTPRQQTTEDRETTEKEKDTLYNCVLKGRFESVIEEVQKGLEKGWTPEFIVEERLVPAIQEVGELYEKNVYYLPQLIASSNAMKKAVDYLEPFLRKESKEGKKPVCIMATVKGDIHDIGKNIVALMLSNNGFHVIDLGKDVDSGKIIDAALKHKADIIGLSALMTVTMQNMKEVIELKNKVCPLVKVMVGGACVTPEYAQAIGADGYAENAAQAVKAAKELLKK